MELDGQTVEVGSGAVMRLLSLEVANYRNIAAAQLEPGRELTVICGNNGQGKTNLLEAIWLLTGGKSFRGGKDAELVRRGETFAVLEAVTQRTRQEDQEPDDPARCAHHGGHAGRTAARAVCIGERLHRPSVRQALRAVFRLWCSTPGT